jgi:hypothetical protein
MATQPKKTEIEIRVDKIEQLFDSFDPLPFRDKDLDHDAEEFIVGWARELPNHDPLDVVVHLPAGEASQLTEDELATAFHRYFDYRSVIIGRELRELFRIGRLSLAIGLAVLAGCLLARSAITNLSGEGEFADIVGEGLVILGWVANWKPLEIFLYDWWPVARRRNLYRRLARASVRLKRSPA